MRLNIQFFHASLVIIWLFRVHQFLRSELFQVGLTGTVLRNRLDTDAFEALQILKGAYKIKVISVDKEVAAASQGWSAY